MAPGFHQPRLALQESREAIKARRMTRRKIMIYGIVAACWSVVVIWLNGAVGRAREDARSSNCVGHLAQLRLAFANYEAIHGCLPPAAITGVDGTPLLSWRVAILPEIEGQGLFDQIKLDEPWDSPHNRRFQTLMPPIFACPSRKGGAASGLTSYVVVVGPHTLFNGTAKGRTSAEISDPGPTLMVVESWNSNINWMEPRELECTSMSFRVNDPARPSISSGHHVGSYPGPHVAALHAVEPGDSAPVGYLGDSIPTATVQALLTIDGGEKVVLRLGPKLD
jgi:hypothetical protein